MSNEINNISLPAYQLFSEDTATLELPFSISELHGMLCGYICIGADRQGEQFLRSLMTTQKNDETRQAVKALFNVYSVTHEQLQGIGLEFQLLLPEDWYTLFERAKAFSEWCIGFVQVVTLVVDNVKVLGDEDSQQALSYIKGFAELEYDNLDVSEQDESALIEISEFTRVAVLQLHADLAAQRDDPAEDLH